MKFHPFSEVFPLLDGAAFDELAADVKANGLREKIWVYEGKILDGRNRFLACQKAKVRVLKRKFRGTPQGALALVISANMQRRHMTESQRAMAAARIATLRQGNSNASREAFTQPEAAEQMGVSRSSVQRARKIVEKGSKALQAAVESGEVPIKKAAAVVDLPKPEQLKAATAEPEREVWSENDDKFIAAKEKEISESIDRVMNADDKIAAARKEIERQAKEITSLKLSRDGWLNGKGEAIKMLKAEQRKTEKLQRETEKLQKELKRVTDENERLKERVAVMETA